MKGAPCKDCSKRCVGCHSTCEDYIDWKAEHDAERERIRRQKLSTCLATKRYERIRCANSLWAQC